MTREYTSEMQWPKSQLKVAAERVAAQLGLTLKARTKAELASFLVCHEAQARRTTKEN